MSARVGVACPLGSVLRVRYVFRGGEWRAE